MDNWLYLIIDLGAASIPFIAGFDQRLKFQKQWRFLFPAILLTMLVFIPWDMVKTDLGVWGFNATYLTGTCDPLVVGHQGLCHEGARTRQVEKRGAG